jgi:hypothetical protein
VSTINVNQILVERGDRYGTFAGHAALTQHLKGVIRQALIERGKVLADDQMEALDMICHKIGRIVNGDPDYFDSWIDVAGYAQLVADRLMGNAR